MVKKALVFILNRFTVKALSKRDNRLVVEHKHKMIAGSVFALLHVDTRERADPTAGRGDVFAASIARTPRTISAPFMLSTRVHGVANIAAPTEMPTVQKASNMPAANSAFMPGMPFRRNSWVKTSRKANQRIIKTQPTIAV